MNERHYRTYTQEFKQEALELLKSSGKSASQLEQELGITPGLLMKWHKRYQVVTVEKKARLEVSDVEAAKRVIHRLERELMEVTEERDILKKVVSIFSRKGV